MNETVARIAVRRHLDRSGDVGVTVSARLVRYWWRLLNTAVFDNCLRYPSSIYVRKLRDDWAWVAADELNNGAITLTINDRFDRKSLFLTVLVHEMVHAWEYQTYRTMSHRRRFFSWRLRIHDLIGLPLTTRV